MTPVLAVDWGTRRLGLAVSDPGRTLARSLPTRPVRSPDHAVQAVLQVAAEEGAAAVLLGLPLNMDGTEGASARAVRDFGVSLERHGLVVRYADERLSSEEAREYLRTRGDRRPEKERVDQVTAVMMLQSFLDTPEGKELA